MTTCDANAAKHVSGSHGFTGDRVEPPLGAVAVDFMRLFEAMPHPYLVVRADASFTIVAVNDRYLAATGTRRDNLLGRKLFDVFPDNPDDASGNAVRDLRTSLERVLRDRVPDVMGVQKYDIPLRDGTDNFRVKYWSPVNTPVAEADGSITLIIHHVEDVTDFVLERERLNQENNEHPGRIEKAEERIQAEVLRRASDLKQANRQIKARGAQLAEVNAQLEDLNRLKSEFFSNVSHEFRTPLTVILGPLEGLLREPSEVVSTRIRAPLEMMYRNALRLLKLVNTLLEFSRLEARCTTSNPQPTDLAIFTAGISSTFQPLCDQAQLKLRIDCRPLAATVRIDREMWEKILLNLLSNAFKFTFAGEIGVRLHSHQGQIELNVHDTGTGIRKEDMPQLFERFHRIRGARGRTYEGTGIGLALVKELVGLLGGTITVESTEGQGTRFTVRVPFEPATPEEIANAHLPRCGGVIPGSPLARGFVEEARRWLPQAPESPATTTTPTVASSGNLILVVDDNADMRSYTCRLLEDAGYRARSASDGLAAWSECKANAPDLVLADVMMPLVNGLELVQRLRSDPQTRDLPIILMSARATEEFRSEGVKSGADDYIMKPFQMRELLARTDSVLHRATERKRAEAQLRQAAAVFTGTNEGVIITDAGRRILAVNSAFSRITGFSAEEVIGKDPNLQKSGRHDTRFYQELWQTLAANGYWQGEIWNRRKNGEIYPAWENISAVKNERDQVVSYVSVFSDIGSLKSAEQRMAHIAHHDPLTGLPNRLLFTARLEQAMAHATRHHKLTALLLLDLDRFKLINDTLGHTAGDALLQAVGERLKSCVRAEDTVARLGGDEFAVVLGEMTHAQDAIIVAEKTLKQISAPVLVEGKKLLTSASVGISIFPDDMDSSGNLIKAADAAMYRAKKKGGNAVEFYTPDLTTEAEEHLAIELELPRALADGEFQLHYQPQMELSTGRIIGVEALLRWKHPTRKDIPPSRIIKVAEDCGFIDKLSRWIIGEATRQAVAWRVQGLPPLQVAINLSSRQFVPNQIVPVIEEALRQASLDGWRILLEVEVTETVVSEVGRCAEILQQLRKLGVGIAIDDFGTGYSSLSRLRSLPIDVLKIDRSFISNIPRDRDDGHIVAAIVSLGHQLGLKIIAEGVETGAQLQFLRAQQCDAVQGYLICQPLSAREVTPFLVSNSVGAGHLDSVESG